MRSKLRASGFLGCLLVLGACSSGGESPGQSVQTGSADATGQVLNPGLNSASAQSPDPQVALQWHLSAANLSASNSTASALLDLALAGLSERGRGVRIALIDGTIDVAHPDLKGRFLDASEICCDWTPIASKPGDAAKSEPQAAIANNVRETGHATGLAALIAANENNGIGGRGVAPQASLIGLNAIASGDDSKIVQALQVALASAASVINNSWSPPEPGEGGSRSFYPAPAAWYDALNDAQSKARGGLGAIVVKASGNGGASFSPSRWQSDAGDSANYDGYAQHPVVITVGAVDAFARPLAASEPGAQVLVSAFSSQTNSPALTSGTETLPAGTSSAAAIVSAVSALMLEAQPRLSWRDLRWILANTARPIPGYDRPGLSSAQSFLRAHGYHQLVGFGLIDAKAAVNASKAFQGLPPLRTCFYSAQDRAPRVIVDRPNASLGSSWQEVPINQDQAKVSFSFDLTASQCPIDRIESVLLSVASSHQDPTGLRITLISPTGHGVQLAAPRDCATSSCTPLTQGFQFHIVRFMAEPAAGRWTLQVSEELGRSSGSLNRLQLTLMGH